jgi:hypothetical protein
MRALVGDTMGCDWMAEMEKAGFCTGDRSLANGPPLPALFGSFCASIWKRVSVDARERSLTHLEQLGATAGFRWAHRLVRWSKMRAAEEANKHISPTGCLAAKGWQQQAEKVRHQSYFSKSANALVVNHNTKNTRARQTQKRK